MPQQNSMEGLQTLLRLRQPSHVQTGDPWLARRQSEIASGLDDFLPDADSPEYKYQQMEQGQHYGVSLPRADARSADMAKLRQILGFKQQEQEAEIAKSVLGQQAQMDRILAAQGGQTYRTQLQQEGTSARSEADRAAREATLETRLGSMEAQQAARDAAAMERAQYNQGQVTARQEAKKPRTLIDILRSFLPGGGEESIPAQPPEQVAAAPRRRLISVE